MGETAKIQTAMRRYIYIVYLTTSLGAQDIKRVNN